MVINYDGYRLVTEDWVSANQQASLYNNENVEYLASLDYDDDKFKSLIREHKYEEAANYASQYHFDDPKVQAQHENDIENLRREGRSLSAFYSRIAPEDMDAIDFNMGVFEDRGLDVLEGNQYADKFAKFKNELGGKGSTSLKITFQPTKRSLFGIDLLDRDNSKSIEKFYDKLGMTQEELNYAGISITEEKGKPILTFNKSHPLANKILYNLAYFNSLSDDPNWLGQLNLNYRDDIEIKGLDNNGKEIKGEVPKFWDYHTNNTESYISKDVALRGIKELVNVTQDISDSYKNLNANTVKVYSSTIGGLIAPELEDLKLQYQNKQITASQYRSALNTQFNNIIGTLKSIGSGAYQMYGNNGENINDETLRSLSNKERAEVMRMISNTDDITLKAMVSNGKIGTLVTIGALEEEKKKIGDNPAFGDMTKSRRWQVFIPGLFTELAQEKINRNTLTRAAQEINSMQDNNYGYKTVDGFEIRANGLGWFTKTKNNKQKDIDKDEAQRLINQDMAILDGRKIKYQFIDAHDYLVNYNGYENLVKQYAYNVINEIYPNIPLEDVYGNPITIEKAFENVNFLGTRIKWYANGTISSNVDEKLKEFYRIYNEIMASADYYIRNGKIEY